MGLRSFINRNNDQILSAMPLQSTSLFVRSRARLTGDREQVFNKFNVNGKSLTNSELRSIMRSLGQSTTPQELDNMIREVDGDGDGCISLQEFIKLNTKGFDSDEVLENQKDAFSFFDIDNNVSFSKGRKSFPIHLTSL